MDDDLRYELLNEYDDDHLDEDAAREWANENRGTLDVEDYSRQVAMCHRAETAGVEELLKSARVRLEVGEYAEAVFNASRAIEGYVRAVYLRPLLSVMTAGIAETLSTSPELVSKMLPSQIKNARNLLLLGFNVLLENEENARKVCKNIVGVFCG